MNEEIIRYGCDQCWLDSTFHGCSLTSSECDLFKTYFPSNDKRIKMNLISWYHIENNLELQFIKATEELSSLSKELCKFFINKKLDQKIDFINLYDELFDAEFMMMQIKRILLSSDQEIKEYTKISENKLEREMKRWDLE